MQTLGLVFMELTPCFLSLSFVFFCPQEQPGLHAHEAVADEGEQVHPGPEQLPLWQRAWDHPFLLQPQAAHQGRRTHVPALPCSHQDTIVLWVTCRRRPPQHSLGHPVAPRFLSLWTEPSRLMGRWTVASQNCWSRLTSLADRFQTCFEGLLHTILYIQTQCCRSLYYFILFYFIYDRHPLHYIADWLSDEHHFIDSWADFS